MGGWPGGLCTITKIEPDPAAPEIVFKNLRGFRSRPPINAINIDIKFQDYLQLLEDREKAMRIGFLHSPNKIKAKIFYKEEQYKAEGNVEDPTKAREGGYVHKDRSGIGNNRRKTFLDLMTSLPDAGGSLYGKRFLVTNR